MKSDIPWKPHGKLLGFHRLCCSPTRPALTIKVRGNPLKTGKKLRISPRLFPNQTHAEYLEQTYVETPQTNGNIPRVLPRLFADRTRADHKVLKVRGDREEISRKPQGNYSGFAAFARRPDPLAPKTRWTRYPHAHAV